MIEIAVKNTDRKIKIDDDIASKIYNLDLRYYNNTSGGFIAIMGDDKNWVRLSSFLAGGNNRTIKYKDGDMFNITRSNMVLTGLRGETQIKDSINNTIRFRGNIFKFDREDFKILSNYTLGYIRRTVVVTSTAKLSKKTGKHQTLSLKKLLFNTTNILIFKNGDTTDYRRENITIGSDKRIKVDKHTIKTHIVRDNYKGVKAYKDLYIVKESSNPSGIYVKCSYIQAAMVYNYLRRKSGDHIKFINHTGYSVEEENRIAEDILQNHSYNTNPTKRINSTSQYLGVNWDTNLNKWMCKGTFFGKRYYLGVYMEEKEAAKAYNKKAIEMLGDQARLNIIV